MITQQLLTKVLDRSGAKIVYAYKASTGEWSLFQSQVNRNDSMRGAEGKVTRARCLNLTVKELRAVCHYAHPDTWVASATAEFDRMLNSRV